MKTTNFRRLCAALISMSMAAGCAIPMVTEAATIPNLNSDFEYELIASAESESQIKITLFTTNNPGLRNLGLAFVWDPAKYELCQRGYDNALVESGAIAGTANGENSEQGILQYGIMFDNDQLTEGHQDYKENFEISFYVEALDGNATDESLSEFIIAVTDYASNTENISYGLGAAYNPDTALPENQINITPNQASTYNYYVGDADGSGTNADGSLKEINPISLSDVAAIQILTSCVSSSHVTNSYNILNHLILNNEVSPAYILNEDTEEYEISGTVNWGTSCSEFVRSINGDSFACVESADANQDGLITTADYNLVMNWYTQFGSSLSSTDILETDHKTIYY